MKKLLVIRFAVLVALATGLAFAGDVTGNWTGEFAGPDGGNVSLTFHFKQDGTRLTGNVDGPGGQALELKEGKVEGDKISFAISFDSGGNAMKIIHAGTVKNDEIDLTVTMDGADGGEGGPMKLKRNK